jgi:hypothetical protein
MRMPKDGAASRHAIDRRAFLGATLAATAASLNTSRPASAQPAATGLSVGYNVTADSYYDGAGKHSNVLVEAGMTGGPVTPLGYPKAGSAVNYLVYFANRYLWQQYKPGTYVIKGTGTGAKVTASGSACSGGSVSTTPAVRFRFTTRIAPMAAPSGDGLISPERPASFMVNVSASGSTDMDDLVVCHVDDEAHQAKGDAASYFTLDALADYTTASRGPLRMMQWQQLTHCYIQDEDDIPADRAIAITNAHTTVNAGDGRRGAKSLHAVPSPEMMARLCVATGMPLWINVNPQMTDATMAAFFRRIASVYATGPIFVELGNEPWNAAYWAINAGYLGVLYPTPGHPGAGAGLVAAPTQAAVNASLAHASLCAWKQAEIVFGGNRVRRVMNVQLGWIDNSISSLDYVDPGILQTGKKVGQLMHSASVATYLGLTPDHWQQGPGSSRGVVAPGWGLGISKRWLVQHQATADALFCEKAWRNSVDQNVQFVRGWNAALSARGYPPIRYEYEGHQPDDSIVPAVAFENAQNGNPTLPAGDANLCVRYTAETGAMVPANGTINGKAYPDGSQSLDAWFTDGDIVQVSWAGSSHPGPCDYKTYKCRLIDGTLYAFDKGAAWTRGLGSQLTGHVDKTILVVNVTRFAAWAEFLNGLWWSNPSRIDGKSILDYMHDAYKAAGFTEAAGFKCVGSAYHPLYTGAGQSAMMQTSAYKPHGHWYPDTPVLKRFKTLT